MSKPATSTATSTATTTELINMCLEYYKQLSPTEPTEPTAPAEPTEPTAPAADRIAAEQLKSQLREDQKKFLSQLSRMDAAMLAAIKSHDAASTAADPRAADPLAADPLAADP